jgi:8-oxo-dGTP pyrophosphatase MutT (NUDIX family)
MAHKRLTVMKESPGLSAFLEYQRSRLRIARATVVNLALAVLAVSALLAYRRPWTVGPATATALGLIVACAAGVVAARAIEDAYVKRLDDAFGLVTGNGEVAVQLVAAVPFARVGDRVELWIVRTRKRRADRWVFPKGHVDASDASPAEAAAREAAEEAGVRGAVDARPFTSFLYGTDDDGDGDVVTAYLLEVERADGKCEPGRDPQRVPPEEAKARLARGRPRRFARELTAVVDAAVAEIEARDSE